MENERERDLIEIAKKIYEYSRKYNIYITGFCVLGGEARVYDLNERQTSIDVSYPPKEEITNVE
jgi:hypothetical protein